jgi:hypothetical protein
MDDDLIATGKDAGLMPIAKIGAALSMSNYQVKKTLASALAKVERRLRGQLEPCDIGRLPDHWDRMMN